DDLGLYGKPMARNSQLWTHDSRRLLDGPHASRTEIENALHAVAAGGLFGYRFLFPPMQVGRHQLFWHRPLAAYLSPQTGQPARLPAAPLGYLTPYEAGSSPTLVSPVELWPRLLRREPHLMALRLRDHHDSHHPRQATVNVRKWLDTHQLLGERPL